VVSAGRQAAAQAGVLRTCAAQLLQAVMASVQMVLHCSLGMRAAAQRLLAQRLLAQQQQGSNPG
jgi:glycine cleavage system pyridoxal-binding protein P